MNGIFEYTQDGVFWENRHILIKVKETDKSYRFELIENTTYLDYDHFIMLFNNTNKISISKSHSPHAMKVWSENDFTIYPHRLGIPFWFNKISKGE